MSADPFNAAVGAALRARRGELQLTQRELAEQASLSPNFIARLERGELGPSLHTAQKLCRALGVKVDFILKEAA